MSQEQSDRDAYERDAYQRYTELQLLEAIELNPETSQADLATRAGVAVGTVNWYLKRWSAKGLVKVKRIGRWQWRYLLTPKGMAEKADLANRYFQASMRIYRQTRQDARQILETASAAGYDSVIILGDGDIAEIVELTCLEMGVVGIRAGDASVRVATGDRALPRIVIDGLQITAEWPEPRQD